MTNLARLTLACFAAIAVPITAPAAPDAAPAAAKGSPAAAKPAADAGRPILGQPGKLLFEDDFASGQMAPKWRVGLGAWEVRDGVVTAAERPADNHGAYAKARFPYKDVVAKFSFRLDGSKSVNFVVDDSTYKGAHAGHICRVTFGQTQVQLGDSKFGTMRNDVYEKMKDPNTTAEQKKAVRESIKDKSATFKTTAAAGQAGWHRARVEIVGDEMLVSVDGRPVGYLRSEGIAHATKNLLGFTVSGQATHLDDVKVWEATTAPDWQARRAEVLAKLPK